MKSCLILLLSALLLAVALQQADKNLLVPATQTRPGNSLSGQSLISADTAEWGQIAPDAESLPSVSAGAQVRTHHKSGVPVSFSAAVLVKILAPVLKLVPKQADLQGA